MVGCWQITRLKSFSTTSSRFQYYTILLDIT